MIGTIDRIESNTSGSGIAVAASIGDVTIQVDDSSDFDIAGGSLTVNGIHYVYTSVDPDSEVVTLAAALSAAADVGDPVAALDVTGEVGVDWTVWVDLGDGGDAVPTDPNHALIPLFPDDPDDLIGAEVVVESVPEGYITRSLASKGAVIGAASVNVPLFVGALLADAVIPDGASYTLLLGWTIIEQVGGMIYDPLTGLVRVPVDGYYAVTGSAVMWESTSAVGRRAVQAHYETYIGPVEGGIYVDDGTTRRVTTPVVTPVKRLKAGEKVGIQVSQTSGADLNVVGDTDAAHTFFSLEYRGPLAG